MEGFDRKSRDLTPRETLDDTLLGGTTALQAVWTCNGFVPVT
ncbi:hypothetical protein [Sphingomonas sp. KC8]|nr:hypothetical protein [Sphingomonas sp. KC8]ARS28345.1 hypothetical protein KC8_13760 [Sphingomonas sp. KC8]